MGIRESLEVLVAAFNRGSLDVPANFLTPRTTFALNNRSYESILGGLGKEPRAARGDGAPQASGDERGRDPATDNNDPLIRLLARGAAGYRTAAKALQYALQSPRVVLESLSEPDGSGVRTAVLRMEGQLRDGDQAFVAGATLRLGCSKDELTSVDVLCAEGDLEQIARSRRT